MNTKPVLLYVLRDPNSLSVRYVGITSGSLRQRLACHISESKKRVESLAHRHKWIRKLLAQGAKPVIELVRELRPDESWQEAERMEIAACRRRGCALVNGTNGGDGTNGRTWRATPEQNKRNGDARRGMKMSQESCDAKSRVLKDKYASDPIAMEKRRAICAAAARSPAARKAASERMKAIWSDPVRRDEMRQRMRGSRARKREVVACV